MDDLISRQAVIDLCESKDPDYKVIHFKEDVECLPSVSTGKLESFDKAKQEIRRGESKAYNADFTMGCEYAISIIERMFEEVEE